MTSLLSKKYYCLLLLLLMAISGCTGNFDNSNKKVLDSNLKNTQVSVHFAIVLVKGVDTADAINSKIEDLPLETQPVLTDRDLISYKWPDQVLELGKDLELSENVPMDGLPFVVIANDKRVYVGAFWTPASSIPARVPVIMVSPSQHKLGGTIQIAGGYPGNINSQSDQKSNQLIYDALKSVEKIKE